MLVLGLDFETNSDQPQTTLVTEIGAILYELDLDYSPFGWAQKKEFSRLCYEESYPPLSQKIVDITGITDELLKKHGKPPEGCFRELIPLVRGADIIMAHKVAFDKTILEVNCAKYNIDLPQKEWLCTLTNFPWPSRITCHKLSHIAYELDVQHDRKSLHRAVNDIDLMAKIMSGFNFKEVLEYARAPWIYFRADIAKPWEDGGVQSSIAKSHGFSFESIKGTDKPKWAKTWVNRTKSKEKFAEIKASVAASASPFRITVIEGIN